MDSQTGLLHRIGTRIAQKRGASGLTLAAVAGRTGVSRAMISRIERGEVHASAVVLDRLCAGLGMSLSNLFAPDIAQSLARFAEQVVWRDPKTHYLRREVTPAGTGSPVKIVEVEIPGETEIIFAPSPYRVIDQYVWMLDGRMDVRNDDAVYHLSKGDCLHMRLEQGNSFRNSGRKPARYAVILTLEGSS